MERKKIRMISFRDVDEDVFRQFKKAAVEERMTLGVALTAAMLAWVRERTKRPAGPDIRNMHKMVGMFKGYPPGDYSGNVDKVLYGHNLHKNDDGE